MLQSDVTAQDVPVYIAESMKRWIIESLPRADTSKLRFTEIAEVFRRVDDVAEKDKLWID